jgi:thiol:disulfide interchange protein DsbC
MRNIVKGVCATTLLGAVLFGGFASAEEASKADQMAQVKERVNGLFPGTPSDKINPSAVDGLYEVMIGPKVIYVSGDGRFMIRGDLIDLETQKNLTEPRENQAQAEAVAAVGAENMITFGDKDAKHEITVFTDIDCGYCRKLHHEMEEYNKAGIAVHYLFFPRAGVDSDSYKTAVSVWCADDRNEAMTQAKAGQEIEEKSCDNPVQEHMALGQMLGVRGTPALVLESGRMVPGYVPAQRLLSFLEDDSADK